MNKNDEGYWIEIFERDINAQVGNGHKLDKIPCPITPEVGGSNKDKLIELFEMAKRNVKKERRRVRIHKFIAFPLIVLMLVFVTVCTTIYSILILYDTILGLKTLSFCIIMIANTLINTALVWYFSVKLIKLSKK